MPAIDSFDLELKGASREMMLNLMRDPVGFDSEIEDDGRTMLVRVNPNSVEGLCEDLRDYQGPHAASARRLFDEVSLEMISEENPPEGGIPANAPPDQEISPYGGMAFEMETCDHEELPPDVVDAAEHINIEAMETGTVPAAANDDIEDAAWAQILLRDHGPIPPPWARYPETFNISMDPVYLPAERASIFEEAADYQEELAIAANPKKEKKPNCLEAAREKRVNPENWAKAMGITGTGFLGANPKLSKGGKKCLLSVGLSLAPYGISGVANLCPFASKGCASGCLNISGLAELYQKAGKIAGGRAKKSAFMYKNKVELPLILVRAVNSWLKFAAMDPTEWSKSMKKDLKWKDTDVCDDHRLVIRMNVLSDLAWEQMYMNVPTKVGNRPDVSCKNTLTIYQMFPDVTCYDYTKNPVRMARFIDYHYNGNTNVDWPANYSLTFSWSEINAPLAFWMLDHGGNVAIPFDTKKNAALPESFCGYPVIDADVHDARFLDDDEHAELRQGGKGLVCGLRLKGNTHRRKYNEKYAQEIAEGAVPGSITDGFVQRAETDMSDKDRKALLIEQANQKAEDQAKDPESWLQQGYQAVYDRDREKFSIV
jgi:hypothetical protein